MYYSDGVKYDPETCRVKICPVCGNEEFSEDAVQGDEELGLTRKIHVTADEALSAAFPGIQAAVVEITTADGRKLCQRVDYPKGEPENPLDEAEFRDRFEGLLRYAGNGNAAALLARVAAGGRAADLTELV